MLISKRQICLAPKYRVTSAQQTILETMIPTLCECYFMRLITILHSLGILACPTIFTTIWSKSSQPSGSYWTFLCTTSERDRSLEMIFFNIPRVLLHVAGDRAQRHRTDITVVIRVTLYLFDTGLGLNSHNAPGKYVTQ